MNEYMIEIEGGEELPVEAETIEMAIKIAEEYIKAHYYDESHLSYEIREAKQPQASEGIHDATAEVMQLLLEKNRKYGDNNLTKFGHTGILVRLHDKLSRLENLRGTEHEEAIEDVYKDIAGYGILGLKLMREGRL